MKTKLLVQHFACLLCMAFIIGLTTNLSAQSLEVVIFDVSGDGEIRTAHNCTPAPQNCNTQSHNIIPWTQDGTLWGETYDYIAGRSYSNHCTSDCGTTRANNSSHLHIKGDESNLIEMDFQQWSHVYTLVETDSYRASAVNAFSFDTGIKIMPGTDQSEGDPVVVNYQIEVSSSGWTDHENINEDSISISSTLLFNSQDITENNFIFNSPGVNGRDGKHIIKSGNMLMNFGDTIDVFFESQDTAVIKNPGFIYSGSQKDYATCYAKGTLIIGFEPIPAPPDPEDPHMYFSLDIGSDSEMSDPNQDGDEFFDPGDAYPFFGTQMTTPTNGIMDDADFFASDPIPDPAIPATVVPCGDGEDMYIPGDFFNINGMALMESSLQDMPYGPGLSPIDQFSDGLVQTADHLLVSYSDNYAENWSYNFSGYYGVPVNSGSTFNNNIYGSTSSADEVFSVMLSSLSVPSPPVITDSLWSESDIHINLAPNPDTLLNDDDDDVNALAYNFDPSLNHRFYFTPSHEAHHGLNPGSVYEYIAINDVQEVVNCETHLGLEDSLDLDAIEFGWVYDSITAPTGYKLALLFSVAADDWTSSNDESGGLDPCHIYYSFLNGTSDVFSLEPLDEDIDAITATRFSYAGFPPDIIVDFPVDIKEHDSQSHIKLYPNPANDHIRIEGKNLKNIQLFTAEGRHIFSKAIDNNATIIALDHLKAGLYFIHIHTGNSVVTKKIIKK